MIRRIAVATAGAALLLTGVSAQQAAADPPCNSGEVCLYRNGSLIAKWPRVFGCRKAPGAFDRLVNRTDYWHYAWSGTNCTGASKGVAPHSSAAINLWWSVSW